MERVRSAVLQRALCALCILSLCSGCGAAQSDAEDPAGNTGVSSVDISQAAESRTLDELSVVEDAVIEAEGKNGWNERQYHAVYRAASGQQCFEWEMSVPCTDRTGVAYDAVNAFFEAEVQAQRERCSTLIAEHITPEMLGGSAGWCYLDRVWTPLWENGRLISFSCGDEGYAGGAHGWDNVSFAVFDLTDGSRLSLPELFTEPEAGVSALTENVLGQIMQEEDAVVNRRENAEGLLPQEAFQTEKFALNQEGVVIHFNPYDIECYAGGHFEYTVPYGSLRAYLKPELFGA